jgi:hypothetical protein
MNLSQTWINRGLCLLNPYYVNTVYNFRVTDDKAHILCFIYIWFVRCGLCSVIWFLVAVPVDVGNPFPKLSSFGRAVAQVVSRWLPTAAAWVRAGVRSCGIFGGESGIGAGFLRVLRFPLPILIPPIAPESPYNIIWGWYTHNQSHSTKNDVA